MPQIKATILADSTNANGSRVTTFELELPRWCWAEMLTHCHLARNAASSRAIPVKKTAAQIKSNPAQPVLWGAQQPGMQSFNELTGINKYLAQKLWNTAAYSAATFSQLLAKLGLHKQYANRISEYAQVYKVVLTATEYDNFYNLRYHKDAQPEIAALANAMYLAQQQSTPQLLYSGEWHLPYITTVRDLTGILCYYNGTQEVSLEAAKRISASCCAQVSYRLMDTSQEKADFVYGKLVESKPIHASPFEHLATPMEHPVLNDGLTIGWEEGVTHMDKYSNLWSGKFKGFIQLRHLIPDNTCYAYKPEP